MKFETQLSKELAKQFEFLFSRKALTYFINKRKAFSRTKTGVGGRRWNQQIKEQYGI